MLTLLAEYHTPACRSLPILSDRTAESDKPTVVTARPLTAGNPQSSTQPGTSGHAEELGRLVEPALNFVGVHRDAPMTRSRA